MRLALISNGKIDSELLSAYRSLCMLDTARKVLKMLIRTKLAEGIRAAEDLGERSTMDAATQVVDAVH